MKQAETYIDLKAECPHCGEGMEVEWADDTVNGLEEWQCENCNEQFTYCHPCNQYGLAV